MLPKLPKVLSVTASHYLLIHIGEAKKTFCILHYVLNCFYLCVAYCPVTLGQKIVSGFDSVSVGGI